MKKVTKRIIKVLAVLLGMIILLLLGYFMKAQYEIKTMHSLETQEILENIFTLKDSFTNMYLIKDGEEYIAFDAGNDINNIKTELEKLHIHPQQVKTVLLTHSDSDHTAALSLFENANVYLSKPEEKLLNGETSRFLFFGNTIDADPYLLLEDQEELLLANTSIKCILLPGHTPGSMAYLINDKYLFVGDALGIENETIIPFNSFFNMDSEQALESMNIIHDMNDIEMIFTAHHGFLKVSSETR